MPVCTCMCEGLFFVLFLVFSVHPFWGFLSFFDLWFAIFHYFRKFLGCYLIKYFSSLFYSSFSGMLDHLILSHNSWVLCSVLFTHFLLSVWIIPIDLSLSSLFFSLSVLVLLMSLLKAYFMSNTRFLYMLEYFQFSIPYSFQISAEICCMHVVHLFS